MQLTASHHFVEERIGPYQTIKLISRGKMAELFLAKRSQSAGPPSQESSSSSNLYAVKRILSHLIYDEDFVAMFDDEASILKNLEHPNIIKLIDIGADKNNRFIVTEYLPGKNLAEISSKIQTLSSASDFYYISTCISQICKGLHHTHAYCDDNGCHAGIIHRDISPQNILVAYDGQVKLLDFGIARASTKMAHTRPGILKGKYAYTAPEQILGSSIDARADLFAVGIVLYEVLCGRRPFDRENSVETLKSIINDDHEPCQALNPQIPDELARIIDRCLEKSPTARYTSAKDIQLELEAFIHTQATHDHHRSVGHWLSTLFADEVANELQFISTHQSQDKLVLPTGSLDSQSSVNRQKGADKSNVASETVSHSLAQDKETSAASLDLNTLVSETNSPLVFVDDEPSRTLVSESPFDMQHQMDSTHLTGTPSVFVTSTHRIDVIHDAAIEDADQTETGYTSNFGDALPVTRKESEAPPTPGDIFTPPPPSQLGEEPVRLVSPKSPLEGKPELGFMAPYTPDTSDIFPQASLAQPIRSNGYRYRPESRVDSAYPVLGGRKKPVRRSRSYPLLRPRPFSPVPSAGAPTSSPRPEDVEERRSPSFLLEPFELSSSSRSAFDAYEAASAARASGSNPVADLPGGPSHADPWAGRQIREVMRTSSHLSKELEDISAPAPGDLATYFASESSWWGWGVNSLFLLACVVLLSFATVQILPFLLPEAPRLVIRTTPPGAKILVNGAVQNGLTPLILSGLVNGVSYEVTLELEGHRATVLENVRLSAGRPLELHVPLEKVADLQDNDSVRRLKR